eukprot:6404929-Alexandrium_andersonii.AAC.1
MPGAPTWTTTCAICRESPCPSPSRLTCAIWTRHAARTPATSSMQTTGGSTSHMCRVAVGTLSSSPRPAALGPVPGKCRPQ